MKRGIYILLLSASILFFIVVYSSNLSAATKCSLNAELVNQDPYPAQPNSYVEVLFQVTGLENPDCNGADFEIIPEFPFSVIGENTKKSINGNTYLKDHKTSWVFSYRIFVDKDAIDGFYNLTAKFSSNMQNSSSATIKKFPIKIEDSKADFELHVKDYSSETKELTIEILNIADVDVEALVLEIPEQEKVKIYGPNKVIAGDLDSNEYTTATFKGVFNKTDIKILIYYTDQIGIRRSLKKSFVFNPEHFVQEQKKEIPWTYYVIGFLILVILFLFYLRKRERKKEREKRKQLLRKG